MQDKLFSIIVIIATSTLMFIGLSLQGIVVGLGVASDSLSPFAGIIGGAYSLGMLFGAAIVAWLIYSVGHVRTFAAFCAVAAISSLMLELSDSPFAWIAIRMTTGFSIAMTYAVVECWLHSQSSNHNRGTVITIYTIANLSSWAIGAAIPQFIEIEANDILRLAAVCITLAIVPMTLIQVSAPSAPPATRLRLGWLFSISPIGFVGCLANGAINGVLLSLGPLFALKLGFGVGPSALFFSMVTIGSLISLVPMTFVADRFDRRIIASVLVFISLIVELYIVFASISSVSELYVIGLLLGASVMTLYSVFSCHANDMSDPENAVEVAATLLLIYCIGAAIGPLIGNALIENLAPNLMFIFPAVTHFSLLVFIIYRVNARAVDPGNVAPTEWVIRAPAASAVSADITWEQEDLEDPHLIKDH